MKPTLRLSGWVLVVCLVVWPIHGCQTTASLSEADAPAYRVQVHLTADRAEAEAVREHAAAWWATLRPDERAAGASPEPAAVVVWQQPYYRVRLGAFPSRAAAADVLPTVRAEFPDAFVVRVQSDA